MTGFLLRLFVKHSDNPQIPSVHSAVGKLAGAVGIACNLLLCLVKFLAGTLAGSVSIVADALNNLSDAASSVITLLGFHMAQRPADKDHPFGHARIEYLSGLVISVMVLLIGVELAKSSVEKIFHPVPLDSSFLTFAAIFCSIGLKFWMSSFFRSLGKKIQSTTLLATAIDCRNDILSTAAVLLGCAAEHFFSLDIDGYIGAAVAVFILYSGIRIAQQTVTPLLGQGPDHQMVKRLHELILSHQGVLGAHDLLVHDYGPGHCYTSIHVEMDARIDPLRCHDIVDSIEQEALQKLNIHLVIHYDPVEMNNEEQNEMRQMIEEIACGIDSRLSVHDLRIIKGKKHPKLVFDMAVPYSMNIRHEHLKETIDEKLLSSGKQYQTVIHFDRKE